MSDEKMTQLNIAPQQSAQSAQSAQSSTHFKPSTFSKKEIGIYANSLITRKISINIIYVGNRLQETIEKEISSKVEGKCIVEGFVKPGSIKIITYSSGILKADNVEFEVVFECMICSPVEGMHIKCIAKNITKAGIRAETDESPSPVIIFIARDHHYMSTYFSEVKEEDVINVRVIGQRFELNDKYISIIAELLNPKPINPKLIRPKNIIKPKLIIKS